MISIKVPPLGESIVEATVSRWLKNEGDAVAAGETLVELETDKITVEVPALKAGTLAKRARGEGDVVKVDEVLGELDETKAGATFSASSAASGATAAGPRGSGAVSGAPAAREAASAPPASSSGSQKSSPAARNIAAEKGVDISAVPGTGRGGVVSKPDVIGAIGGAGTGAAPIPASSAPRPAAPTKAIPTFTGGGSNAERETREKMSTRRKRIAENLLQSQHATAHLTTFNEVDMSALNSLRDKFKEKVEKQYGVKLTFMPFFVKAACPCGLRP